MLGGLLEVALRVVVGVVEFVRLVDVAIGFAVVIVLEILVLVRVVDGRGVEHGEIGRETTPNTLTQLTPLLPTRLCTSHHHHHPH